jgi:hypothetical protein
MPLKYMSRVDNSLPSSYSSVERNFKKQKSRSSSAIGQLSLVFPATVHGYAVVDSKCQVLLCSTWDLGELDKEFPISGSKGLSPIIAPHPVVVKSHITTASLIGHFLTASKTFALVTM